MQLHVQLSGFDNTANGHFYSEEVFNDTIDHLHGRAVPITYNGEINIGYGFCEANYPSMEIDVTLTNSSIIEFFDAYGISDNLAIIPVGIGKVNDNNEVTIIRITHFKLISNPALDCKMYIVR